MTTEQEALLRKARSSMAAARLLAEQAYYDFSISRAYYAMFYVAQAFLEGEGLSFSKHAAVIAAFGQHFAKTGRIPAEYHRYLIESAQRRNVGDYDIQSELTKADADEQLVRAEEFLRLAEQFIRGGQ
ncbi:MAG: HEPN domain-containing protein [Blastocatellia bacterium]|nr:HEPN domain-containing protein [Blastocatellia bacterium]